MGETQRTSQSHLNLWARSSDIRSHKQCDMRTVLSMLWPDPLPTPVWFAVGTAVHAGVEYACLNADADQHDATQHAIEVFDEIARDSDGFIESARRTARTARAEIIDYMGKWWRQVHPSSDERLPQYEELEWPPLVEVNFVGDGFAGQVDAVFYDPVSDSHVIVDWKTGGTAKSDEAQLHFYHYGLRKSFDDYKQDGEHMQAWFHHIVKGKVQYAAQKYYGDSTIEGWIKWSSSIKQDRTFAAYPGWYCDYCECRSACPVFNDTEQQVGELIRDALLDEQHPDYKE